MKVRVLYHDHCFDGAASAAYITRFLQSQQYGSADFYYTGLAHRADQLFEDSLFDGDANVIVDFKYATHPNLTWWFDHHQSAFLSPEDAEHFKLDKSGQKLLDPSYRSCTKFISTVVKNRYAFSAPDLEDLVTWADIVDGALYESAKAAVEMEAPAMKLTLVIEGSKGPTLVQKIIRLMQKDSLAAIIAEPTIQAEYQRLHEIHLRNIDVIRSYGLSGWGLYRDVILPGALPSILVGVRFALGLVWVLLIVAETISAQAGIGYMTMNAREFLQTDVVLVGILLYALLGKLADSLSRAIEYRTLRWHPGYQRKHRHG